MLNITKKTLNQEGFGLIEVMIALLVLAVGVLGFIAMQAQSLKSSDDALSRTKALTLSQDLVARIRNNSIQDSIIVEYYKAFNLASLTSSCTSNCSPAEVAKEDVVQIKAVATDDGMQVKLKTCPGAKGNKLQDDKTSELGNTCVIISWGDTLPTIDNDADNANNACIKDTWTYHSNSSCIAMELL